MVGTASTDCFLFFPGVVVDLFNGSKIFICSCLNVCYNFFLFSSSNGILFMKYSYGKKSVFWIYIVNWIHFDHILALYYYFGLSLNENNFSQLKFGKINNFALIFISHKAQIKNSANNIPCLSNKKRNESEKNINIHLC